MIFQHTLWGAASRLFFLVLFLRATVICAVETVVTTGDSSCSDDLALCLSQKVAVETRENILQDNLKDIEEQAATATQTLRTELEKETRVLQSKLDEEAERYRKEIESLREIHNTQLGLMLQKNSELEETVSALKLEKQTALDQIHVLQKQVEIFTEQHQDVVELQALRESCTTAANEHQQAAASWEETRLTMVAEHETALESSRRELSAAATESCNEQIQQQMESSAKACNEKLAVNAEQCSARVAQASTCEDAIAQCQAACSENCAKDIASQKAVAGRWKRRHDRVLASQQALQEEATNASKKLRETRNELFEIRRELFLSKEQLRKPRIRRRMLYSWAAGYVMPIVQWVTATYAAMPETLEHIHREKFPIIGKTAVMLMDGVQEGWEQAEDAFREATGWHKAAKIRGVPSSKSWYDVLVRDPCGQLLLLYKQAQPFYRDHVVPLHQEHVLGAYQRHILPFYQSSIAPIYHDHVLPHHEKYTLPFYTEKVLPFYRDSVAPAYREFIQPLHDQYISPALKELQARLLRAAHTHEEYSQTIAKSFAWWADVVADYGSLQDYAILSVMGSWFRDHALLVVRCTEGALVAWIVVVPLLFRKKATKKV